MSRIRPFKSNMHDIKTSISVWSRRIDSKFFIAAGLTALVATPTVFASINDASDNEPAATVKQSDSSKPDTKIESLKNNQTIDIRANSDSTSKQQPPAASTITPEAGAASPETEVKVNGQNVTIPKNGTFHKRITNSNGNTTLDISITSNSSKSSESSSSVDVNLNSVTESSSGE